MLARQRRSWPPSDPDSVNTSARFNGGQEAVITPRLSQARHPLLSRAKSSPPRSSSWLPVGRQRELPNLLSPGITCLHWARRFCPSRSHPDSEDAPRGPSLDRLLVSSLRPRGFVRRAADGQKGRPTTLSGRILDSSSSHRQWQSLTTHLQAQALGPDYSQACQRCFWSTSLKPSHNLESRHGGYGGSRSLSSPTRLPWHHGFTPSFPLLPGSTSV